MTQPNLRAADVDRARVADALGQHMAAGRLTIDEYDERLAQAYAARTYGELDRVTTDLPPLSPRDAPVAAPGSDTARSAAAGSAPAVAHRGDAMRAAWLSWLGTGLLVTTIWLLTSLGSGAALYFWPMWVIGPWGIGLLAATLRGGASRAGRPCTGRR